MNKPGRNDPCPCGSGKKYKRCCLPPAAQSSPPVVDENTFDDLKQAGEQAFHDIPGEGLTPAQELVYDGWELMDSDTREAGRCFRKAVSLDPGMADAYNGLAEVSLAGNDISAAEKHYLTAYDKAKAFLGTEDENAFSWWGELETRPYMRSRHGLALLYYNHGRYAEAIPLFEDLLKRNPNDNQGVRYLFAPAHLLNGDLPRAVEAFDRFERENPDDVPEPHFLLNWGLASFMAGRYEDAAARFRSTGFANPYLLPLALGRKPKILRIWHSDNLMLPTYAREYVQIYGVLWLGRDEARLFAEFVWDDEEVAGDFRRWIEIRTEANGLEVSERRTALIDESYKIEGKRLSRAFVRRMNAFLESAARPA